MEDENRSVIINIPKIRAYAKGSENSNTTVKRRSKFQSASYVRKPSEISLQKYSLPGNKPLKVEKLSNELLLLPFRLFSKRQERDRHKAKLAITIYEKYKICSIDLRRRLHIDGPADDTRGMTDIDTLFFKCVNGRQIRSSSIPLFKSLMPIMDNLFRMRQEVSYRNDCILRIETNMRKEFLTYNNSVRRCKDQACYFDSFILNDYLSSMGFLNKCDELKTKLIIKANELQNLANDKFAIMSRLIGLDYRYSVQQKYGRFLYYISPSTWRLKNRDFAKSIEIEQKGFDLGYSSDEDPFVVIFEKLKKEGYQNSVAPALYFHRPVDLMQVFETVEQQQLNYLTHVTYSTPYTDTLKKRLTILKTSMQQSSHSVVKSINEFKVILENCFTRCKFLESRFHKIIDGMFYDSVGSVDVLKLTLHLEYCYEKLIGEKPINLSMVAVAKAVESCYMDYAKRLEDIRNCDIKGAVTHNIIELERRKMRKARLAARELRLFQRLERDLLRSCLPAYQSKPVSIPLTKPPLPLKATKGQRVPVATEATRTSLTEAEVEYLTLFTDWTETDDPADYLQALTMRQQGKSDET